MYGSMQISKLFFFNRTLHENDRKSYRRSAKSRESSGGSERDYKSLIDIFADSALEHVSLFLAKIFSLSMITFLTSFMNALNYFFANESLTVSYHVKEERLFFNDQHASIHRNS
jgi:hypothetical protein